MIAISNGDRRTVEVKWPKMMKEISLALFRKPSTQQYPFVKVHAPEGFRGRQVFHSDRCISCGLCARDCPADAIEMFESSGKKIPLFHLERCIFCYVCVENCPRNAITGSTFYEMASTKKADLTLKTDESVLDGDLAESDES